MRLFVAAELPQGMVEALSETLAELRECVHGRAVGTDQFHVTLAFLGEVPATRVDEVAAIVDAACAGRRPISATLGPLGSFGRDTSATLWEGLAGPQVGALAELADDLRGRLRDAGLPTDPKGFLAHVTLMRRADLPRAAREHGGLPMPTVAHGVIDTVTLFRSELCRDRAPVYTPLHEARLAEP